MEKKMWAGRFKESLNSLADQFNSSILVDSKMLEEDILGSVAHAHMLGACEIITVEESEKLAEGLKGILSDVKSGSLEIDYDSEDVHMFVEAELTKRLGDVGKKLHTARSRNDQVATDMRLYLKKKSIEVQKTLLTLIDTLSCLAEKYSDTVMPGYTHLQVAQPINFGHHLLAYANMFIRDYSRFEDCVKRMDICPLGSCALAGTTYSVNRFQTAEELGFSAPSQNSIDSVSDRDFVIELCFDISLVMMHLSRFSEEIILWCSWEFKFVELSDAFSTGSSIMPQKKNPDMAELVRGKTGRVYGNLFSILTVMKGLPLAYNKDMQEDKESVFDSVDTVLICLNVFTSMIGTMSVNEGIMLAAAKKGFINATDCADYLVGKGIPFRDAYKITGELVAYCLEKSMTLEELPLEEYKKFSPLFGEEVYQAVDMKNCAEKRNSYGGASSESVKNQALELKAFVNSKTQK